MKFTILLQRQFYEYNSLEIEALDIDKARAFALKFIEDENLGETYDADFHSEWSRGDLPGDIELNEVYETEVTNELPQSHVDWIASQREGT